MIQPITGPSALRLQAPLQAQSVRAALNSLLYSTGNRASDLEHLWLVDAYLFDPDNPLNPGERQLALHTVLIHLITEELEHHRVALQSQPPNPAEDLASAKVQIGVDAGTGNIELIAWSWLYYRYVRVDLDLTPRAFCQSAHCDERSRRRYASHGIRRLTERLIERERTARRQLWKQRLIIELPAPFPVHLFGRNEVLAQARDWLAHPAPPVIHVSGEVGSGKTTFVAELLRAEIDAGRIGELIWLVRPPSCAAVIDAVKQRLMLNGLNPNSPFAQGKLHMLVLDDLTLLANDLTAVNRMLTALTPLTICLIDQTALPFAPVSVHVRLGGLPLDAAHALIRWHEGRVLTAFALTDADIMAIWGAARGNPAALLREFGALISE